jgi:hypothetical protein
MWFPDFTSVPPIWFRDYFNSLSTFGFLTLLQPILCGSLISLQPVLSGFLTSLQQFLYGFLISLYPESIACLDSRNSV